MTHLPESTSEDLLRLDPELIMEQRLALYQGNHGFVTTAESRAFSKRTRRNLVDYPDQVTTKYETGEAVGSGKFGAIGDDIATLMFNPEFSKVLRHRTDKVGPMPHYLSLGTALRYLSTHPSVPEDSRVDNSNHPIYQPEDLLKGWYWMVKIINAARQNLPLMDPYHAHLLYIECPTHLLGTDLFLGPNYPQKGSAITIDPNTFLEVRPTLFQASEDAGHIRAGEPSTKVVLDGPAGGADYSWNEGNFNSQRAGRRIMNARMLEMQDAGRFSGVLGEFDQLRLDTDPEYRNQIVLPLFMNEKRKEWQFSRWNYNMSNETYNPHPMPYFKELIWGNGIDHPGFVLAIEEVLKASR